MEAGKMEIEYVEFEPGSVLEDTLSVVAHSAEKKNIDLICDVDANIPKRVVGDPARLRNEYECLILEGQILVNLVSNAVKFSKSCGGQEVVVSVKLAHHQMPDRCKYDHVCAFCSFFSQKSSISG